MPDRADIQRCDSQRNAHARKRAGKLPNTDKTHEGDNTNECGKRGEERDCDSGDQHDRSRDCLRKVAPGLPRRPLAGWFSRVGPGEKTRARNERSVDAIRSSAVRFPSRQASYRSAQCVPWSLHPATFPRAQRHPQSLAVLLQAVELILRLAAYTADGHTTVLGLALGLLDVLLAPLLRQSGQDTRTTLPSSVGFTPRSDSRSVRMISWRRGTVEGRNQNRASSESMS